MPLLFLYNNLHFAIEIFGALAFLVVSWLAFDAFRLRRDFLTASRGLGFLSLTVWQVIHALYGDSPIWGYAGYGFEFLGLLLVSLNLILEKPVARPEFRAILILPPLAFLSPYINSAASFLYFAIAFYALRQYQYELKKTLKPFWVAFIFLALGNLAAIFYGEDIRNWVWILGHLLELAGFLSIVWWVWKYLELRVREEMTLIFFFMSLLISIMVTLAFSFILVKNIRDELRESLLTNAKVMDFAVRGLEEEALAKVRFLAEEGRLAALLSRNDFVGLERLMSEFLEKEKLGFLTALDKNGDVVLRAHALSRRGDNLSQEKAVQRAMLGGDLASIETSPSEGFSIRAASPLRSGGKIAGVLVAGFPLDGALLDNIKRLTGLDILVYEKDTAVASTIVDISGRGRLTGIRETNAEVLQKVLENGESFSADVLVGSRQFLASYLPIYNAAGRTVGMLSSVKPQREVVELVNVTNRLTLFVVIIIMLLLALPIYFLTRRLGSEIK